MAAQLDATIAHAYGHVTYALISISAAGHLPAGHLVVTDRPGSTQPDPPEGKCKHTAHDKWSTIYINVRRSCCDTLCRRLTDADAMQIFGKHIR